jgi:hypothetical protein
MYRRPVSDLIFPPPSFLLRLASLVKIITLRGAHISPKLGGLKNLQLEVNVVRSLLLVAIAHISPILPRIACYSCLLARTTRVGVTGMRWCDTVPPNSSGHAKA